tara:strand:- start:546 stop:1847 length:1302 start_codon:yes stop_codon:yes gene_type:complete
MTKELNIGIVGLGTVGSGVIKSIEKNEEYFKSNYDVKFNILGISANSKNKKRSFNVDLYRWFDNPLKLISETKIDTIIELVGGEDGLAYQLAIKSLKNKMNFITANKALISKHGEELALLSEENDNFFGFEASVAGGIPIIKTLKESIILSEIQKIFAILNGTSNYILSNMSKSQITFEEALRDAQEKGYAEADPTLDINGEDSAHKLSILNSIIFSEIPSVESIYISGIESIELIDHHYSSDFGYNIRLIAQSAISDEGVYKEVTPMLVDKTSSLGRVDGANNIIKIIGQASGDVVLEGQGAGEGPTSSSVISDLVDCAIGSKLHLFSNSFSELCKNSKKILPLERPYYLRVFLKDQKGSMSNLTNLLSQNNISLDKVIQKDEFNDNETNFKPVVIITYPVKKDEIDTLIDILSNSDIVSSKPLHMPILNKG